MKTIDADNYAFILDSMIREREIMTGKSLDEYLHDVAEATGMKKARRALDLMPFVERVNQNLLDDVNRYVEEHYEGEQGLDEAQLT